MFEIALAAVSTVVKPIRSLGDSSESLDDVEERTTLRDVITPSEIAHQFEGGWDVTFEITQGRSGSLNQVATITHNQLPTEYRLEPTDTFDPNGEVAVTRRQSPSSGRDVLNTTETLGDAITLLSQRLRATTVPSPVEQPQAAEPATPTTAPSL
ncbi:hypothetical protein [Halorubrum sp. AJ67]|uniref:hypothetical protein n=1 Tax=Halorubrum sp. AJ67 TaxID=1173487 RepID=UPI0003DC9FCD|nr:hypothetical protein [Halorubrum sp. AJ67]CDK38205.1 hypothetical protein BN903_405 [Halorubrum sp. AJ67]